MFYLAIKANTMTPTITPPIFPKRWLLVSALLLFFGIMLGAFGAHALPKWTDPTLLPKALAWWQTATQYLLINALGIMLVSVLMAFGWCKKSVVFCLVLGIIIFSGSLYLMAIGFPRWLGAVTPIGGTLLMIGWGLLCWQLITQKSL